MGKEFKTSMAFINTENEEGQPQQEEPKQKPRKTDEDGKKKAKPKKDPGDVRSRRVQAVFTPNLYRKMDAYAWKNRKSMNSLIVEAVEEYLRRHK